MSIQERNARDVVNFPAHYTFSKVEVIDAIEAWELGFHRGNAVKYIARAKYKGSELEDLKKARWYLDREIKRLEQDALAKSLETQTSDQLRAEIVKQGGYRSGREIIPDEKR